MSQVQMVEAKTKAETQKVEAQANADSRRVEAEADAEAQRRAAETHAHVTRITAEAEVQAVRQRAASAAEYTTHPALLRLEELRTLQDLSRLANARIYIGFDKHSDAKNGDE